MLYIFDVANGTMLTFDVKFAFQSISKLKEEIEKKLSIRVVHQVLLMSGGATLEPNAQISSYSTGTDTNPVYLFTKVYSEISAESLSVSTSEQDKLDCDLQKMVFNSSGMSANYKSLVARTQMSQQIYELGRQKSQICQTLVKEQHFQQQGWQAIVAHLDDLVCNCQCNIETLEKTFDAYTVDRQQHFDILAELDKDKDILAKIPILPELLNKQESSLNLLSDDSIISCNESLEAMTLLNYVSPQRLKQLSDQCTRGLKRFDEFSMNALRLEIDTVMAAANEQNLKEIKQVCERLYSLEEMMHQLKKLLQDQSKISQGFQDVYKSITDTKDEGKIADMCLSHHDWMSKMLDNHNHIRFIWQRCVKAKEKLSVSIQRRLARMIEVESKVEELGVKIAMYNDSLCRLCKELEILRQVHQAPEMYVNAVAEVVRRKNFSAAFSTWSNKLASEMQLLHSQEVEKRREFQSKFEEHFLNSLFAGLEDLPPAFATETPVTFDEKLPNLNMKDLECLKNELPELDISFSLPDLDTAAVSYFSKNSSDSEGGKEVKCNCDSVVLDTSHSKSCFANSTRYQPSESDYNISKLIQSFDESFKIRTRRLCEDRQQYGHINDFELLDFKNVIETRKEKIDSLKSLIAEKERASEKDHLYHLMKQKLIFEEDSVKKLQSIYKEIEVKRSQTKMYQEKLLKETKEVKLLEAMFKRSLDKYDKKSKELYD